MTVLIGSPFKSKPRISEATFVDVLAFRGSFAVDALWAPTPPNQRPVEARRIYQTIVAAGHDPAVWLAIAGKEHSFGVNSKSVLWRNHTRSWTNARSVRHPEVKARAEIIQDSERGSQYVRYQSVYDSVLDGLYRVDEPGYAYREAGAVSIIDHIRIWAPGSDGNRPEDYARTMVGWINDWIADEREKEPTAPAPVISGLIDVRNQLPRNTGSPKPYGPRESLPLSQKRGVVFHYNGPPVSKPGSLDAVKSFASYHVSKNWARVGNLPVYGDGLMYHVAIGANGEKWLCRDLEAVLWHCGVTYWNERALSIQMIIGDGQRVTEAAKQAAFEVVDDWRKATSTARSEVWGHGELSPTSCPGSVQQDIVLPYRNGKDRPMADGHYFGETGHYVGGGFWQYWNERGGLPIFGYPITDEFDIISTDPGTKGRRITVQVFERAVFEYHRENKPPYDILLRRLGADIKDELLSQAVAA